MNKVIIYITKTDMFNRNLIYNVIIGFVKSTAEYRAVTQDRKPLRERRKTSGGEKMVEFFL